MELRSSKQKTNLAFLKMFKTNLYIGAQSCSLHLDNNTIVSRAESMEIHLGFTSQLSN